MNTHLDQSHIVPNSAGGDKIAWIKLSSIYLPLKTPISDAKVLTGRQRPLTEVAFLFVEIETTSGQSGLGFSYSKRAGGQASSSMLKKLPMFSLVKTPAISERSG